MAPITEATTYVEPFLGGAAVFLAGNWESAILADVNVELIRCYRGLANDAAGVRSKLKSLSVDSDTYSRVARWRPRSDVSAAARILYLNRCGYGGVYRENAKGEYNVPFSGDRRLEPLLEGCRIEDVGSKLGTAELIAGDFEMTLTLAGSDSLVYCDPPYALPRGESPFLRYSWPPFRWADQVRLAECLHSVVASGATAILSNSSDRSIRSLYTGAVVVPITRRSSLAKTRSSRMEALYVLSADRSVAQRLGKKLSEDLV